MFWFSRSQEDKEKAEKPEAPADVPVKVDNLKTSEKVEKGYIHISEKIQKAGSYWQHFKSSVQNVLPSFKRTGKQQEVKTIGIYCYKGQGESLLKQLICGHFESDRIEFDSWRSFITSNGAKEEVKFIVRHLETGEPQDLNNKDHAAIIVGQLANPNPLDSLLKAAETQFSDRVAVVASGVNADADEYFANLAKDLDNLQDFAWFQQKRYVCMPNREPSKDLSEPIRVRLQEILGRFVAKNQSWMRRNLMTPYVTYPVGGLCALGVTYYLVRRYRSKLEEPKQIPVKKIDPSGNRWDNRVRNHLKNAGEDIGAAGLEIASRFGLLFRSLGTEINTLVDKGFEAAGADPNCERTKYIKTGVIMTVVGTTMGLLI